MKNILIAFGLSLTTIFLTNDVAFAYGANRVRVRQPAATYAWRVGPWSRCSVRTCGAKGVQRRSVQCVMNNRYVVSDRKCVQAKPAVSQPCSGVCPLPTTTTTTLPKVTTTTTTLPVVTTTTLRPTTTTTTLRPTTTTTTLPPTTTTTLPPTTTTTLRPTTTTTTLPPTTTTTLRPTTTTTTLPPTTTTTLRPTTTTTTLPPTTTTLPPTTTTTMPPVGGGGIISGHPRIWLSDSNNFSRIKAAVSSNSALWTNLKSFCDSKTSSIPSGNAYQGDLQYQYIASFALCYQASGNAAYAQKAIALLTTNDCGSISNSPTLGCSPLYFSIYSTDSGYGIRNYVPALALAYDWLYPYMSTAVSVSDLSATTLGGAIIQRINGWFAWFSKSAYCRAGDTNCESFDGPHTGIGLSNYYSGYVLAQSLAAVAIGNDDASGASILSVANSLFNTGIGDLDTYLPEGHHPEGSYGAGSYQRYALAATALRWGTGNTSYLNSKWLQNYPAFKLAAITNDGKFYIDDGMWHWDVSPTTFDSVMSGYAYGWSSSIGQTVAAYIGIAGGVGSGWDTFLFYDPSSAATALSLASAPRSYNAATFGMALMRSDWNSVNATWASLSTARWTDPQGEAYPDAGQVEIYKGSPLLINAGFGDRWGASQNDSAPYYNTFSFEGRTDGGGNGQRWFVTANCPNPTGSDPIGLKKFSDGNDYVYAAGEFSAAYQSSCTASGVPANFLVRNQLFVRPDLVFVYDQVSVKSGVPTEHFHFATSPVANGGNQWTITNGNGVLQMAALYPAVTANVVSQPANSLKYSDGSTGPQNSNYHMTMRANSQTAYQNFLNVFRAGLSGSSYPMPSFQNLAPSVGVGVRITNMLSSENATPVVVIFADNTQNSPATSVQYVVASSPGAYHYVALLQPNTQYQVSETVSGGQATIVISPSSSGNMKSDSAGVLRFTE